MLRKIPHDLACKFLAHAQARLVHRQVVEDRIRPREVHELEDAGRVADLARISAAVQYAAIFYEDGLAGLHIAQSLELQNVERDALGRHHVLGAFGRAARAEHEWTDAIRVAKRDDAETDDHRDDSVTAPAAAVDGFDRIEDLLGRRAAVGTRLQFVCEHVKQHFRIRAGVEMAPVHARQEFGEFLLIGQIAVVAEAYAVR